MEKMTDTETRLKGIQILTDQLGDVEAERFLALIQRELFDYTKWRQGLEEDISIEEISKKAMTLRKKRRTVAQGFSLDGYCIIRCAGNYFQMLACRTRCNIHQT